MVLAAGPFPLSSHPRCVRGVVKTHCWPPWQGWDVKGKCSILLEEPLSEKTLLNWLIFYQLSVWLCRFLRRQMWQMILLTTQGTVFQEGDRVLVWKLGWRWCPGCAEPWLANADGPIPPPLKWLDQQSMGKAVHTLGRVCSWWSDGHLVGSSPKAPRLLPAVSGDRHHHSQCPAEMQKRGLK